MNFETEENFYQKKLTTGTYHHVGVSDSFHFVHIVTLNDGIKQSVQVVQEVNHLLAKEKTKTKKKLDSEFVPALKRAWGYIPGTACSLQTFS